MDNVGGERTDIALSRRLSNSLIQPSYQILKKR